MKSILTAGALSLALLLAVVSAVQAEQAKTSQDDSVMETVLASE